MSFKEYSDRIKWKFPVTSITQYEFVDSFIQKNELKEYEILPIYNGNNLDFFEEYVFMTKEEFNEINLSKREVFINMTLNVNHFGKLTVLPDKKVYASVNEYPLGDIETPVYDILFKEMTEGHSWLQVRDEEPCSECVYQWLCPSPGGFEKAIGKLNLCHVFPSKKNRGEAVVNE